MKSFLGAVPVAAGASGASLEAGECMRSGRGRSSAQCSVDIAGGSLPVRCRTTRRDRAGKCGGTMNEDHHVNGRPLRGDYPGAERAVFGMGCFWGAERMFWREPGVVVTAAGYAGGDTAAPGYRQVCSGQTGHAEVVLVVFEPADVDYARLLQLFWEGHDPTQGMRQGNDVGSQYRSVIHCTSEAQH